MENVIEVLDACKTVKEKELLKHVTFRVHRGEIIGIVGRNGSGKTVLFKCICGFMKLSAGEIFVNGKKIGENSRMAERTGIILETPGFLPGYSGFRNLSFLAGISGAKEEGIRASMEAVGLDPDSRKPVKNYSMGMIQRLAIAQAIMEDPEVLILDEPMNGLDNHGVRDIRALLLALKERGKTILIASHIKEDIDLLCNRVYRMDGGVLS